MPSFTVFRPNTATGTLFGLAITVVSLLLGGVVLTKGLHMDTTFSQFWPLLAGTLLIALGVLYGYWTWSCRTMSYVVDRNALSIRWGGIRQVVPIDQIERLIPADEGENPRIDGINLWPGHKVGRGEVADLGEVLFYSTHRTWQELLYVYTPYQTYAISVPDAVFFAETVQSNQQRGALFEQKQAVHRWGVSAQTFWSDAQAQIFAAVLVASFFVLLGYVLNTYDGLAQTINVRFPSVGGIVRPTDKSVMLDIPRTAAGFLGVNLTLAILLHSWERMVGYVLLITGIVIQVVLLVAAIVAVA